MAKPNPQISRYNVIHFRGSVPGKGLTDSDLDRLVGYMSRECKKGEAVLIHPPRIEKDPRWPTDFVPRTYQIGGCTMYIAGPYKLVTLTGEGFAPSRLAERLREEKDVRFLTKR